MISLNLKKDVESMSGDGYDIANEVVNEVQWQVEEYKSYLWFLFKAEPGVKRHWSYEMSTRKWGILSCNTIIILYN